MTLLSTSSSTSATTAKPRHRDSSAVHSAPTSVPHTPTSGSSPAPSLALKAHGVRAHLAELLPLPRHALFAVRLTIHQLWNVPLVAGEFSVKWKFQHVHRMRRPGSANGSCAIGSSGRVAIDSAKILSGKGKGREVVDPDHDSLMPSGASMLSIPSTSEGSSSPSTSPRAPYVDLPNASQNGGDNGTEFSQEARGRTSYVALRDHHVKWSKSVNVAVQMGIQRDTLELQSCELKLVVEQLCVPGDPDAPANPRLGAVYLNLAEYVDKGAVTRRYLLRQSKTNATLQLTLELTHIDGDSAYNAPPLQKGEVMAGVATLLEKSAVGGVLRPAYDRPLSRPSIRGHRRATDNGSRAGSRSHTPLPELGIAGLRTTDNIIEAIFNPVPTSSSAPSPFTYYVPPKPKPRPAALDIDPGSADVGSMNAVSADADVRTGAEEERPPSIAPSARSEKSMATTASLESAGTNGEPHRRKWWKKLAGGSRPASPQPQPQPPSPMHPASSSVRSSPGATRERHLHDLHLSTDNHSAPQIVVRSPTSSKAPSSLSSGSWSHRS